MLAGWGTSQLLVPRIAQEAVTASASPLTLSTRPMRVLDSTVHDGELDYPVASFSREDWFAISNKGQIGRPQALWWDEKLSPLSVYLWPVPDKAYQLTLQRWEALTSFANLDAVMDLPAEYEEALVFNLAVRIAPRFGASVSAEVAAVANASLNAIIKYHAREIPTLSTDLVGSISRRYGDWRGQW